MIKCLSVTNERISTNEINCPQYEVLEVGFSSELKQISASKISIFDMVGGEASSRPPHDIFSYKQNRLLSFIKAVINLPILSNAPGYNLR